MSTDGLDPRSGLPSHNSSTDETENRVTVRLPPALHAKLETLDDVFGNRSEAIRAAIWSMDVPDSVDMDLVECEDCEQLFLGTEHLYGHFGQTDCQVHTDKDTEDGDA